MQAGGAGGGAVTRRVDWVLLVVAIAFAALSMSKDQGAFDAYGVSNRFTLTTIWQWGALAVATRMIWFDSPHGLRRRALLLSFVGSLTVFLNSRWLPHWPVNFVTSPRSAFELTAAVGLWCAPGLVAGSLIVRLPSTPASPQLRTVVRTVTVGGLAAALVLALAFSHLTPEQVLHSVLWYWFLPATFVMATFAIWMSFTAWNDVVPRFRTAGQVLTSAAVAVGLAVLSAVVSRSSPALGRSSDPGNAVLPMVAVAILAGDFWVGDRLKRVFRLVSPHGTPSELQESIRAVFNDPALRLSLQSGDEGRFVDVNGRVVSASSFDGAHARLVPADGPAIAAIHWSRATTGRPANTDVLLGIAELAIEKAQLQARVLAQLNDLTASRRRLVDATDRARQAVERDLHDGAQQRLAALLLTLRMAAGSAASPEARTLAERTATDLLAAVAELQDLARGIHPAALTMSGLGAAIEGLAERTPFPTRVDVVDERFPAAVELTAYYVIAESLANVAKHAAAGSVEVLVHRRGDDLSIVVTDDGRGGADADGGSGLTGLADRVGALGGTMDIRSEAGTGTSVEVLLPVVDPITQETT